jgi:hypothetical protein
MWYIFIIRSQILDRFLQKRKKEKYFNKWLGSGFLGTNCLQEVNRRTSPGTQFLSVHYLLV